MESRPAMVLFRSPASLTDLVTSIQAFDLPSMDKLRVVGDSLSQIQDWFDDNLAHTLGEVKRKLAAIMTQGTAVFRVSDVHGMALEIHFPGFKHSRVVNHVMTEEQLDVGALPPPPPPLVSLLHRLLCRISSSPSYSTPTTRPVPSPRKPRRM